MTHTLTHTHTHILNEFPISRPILFLIHEHLGHSAKDQSKHAGTLVVTALYYDNC